MRPRSRSTRRAPRSRTRSQRSRPRRPKLKVQGTPWFFFAVGFNPPVNFQPRSFTPSEFRTPIDQALKAGSTVRARRIGALLVATALSLAIAAGVGASTSSPGTALVDGIPQRGTVIGQVERERDADPVRGPRLHPLRRVHEGRLPDDHQRLRQDRARQGRLPRARRRHPRLRAGAALHAGRVAAEEALAGRRAVLREPVAAERARDRRGREADGRRRQGPQREAARGRLEDARR